MGITRSYSRGFSNCSTRDKNTSRVPPDMAGAGRIWNAGERKAHESIVFSSSDFKQAECVVCSLYVYERLLTKTGSGCFLKLCLSEDLESDQWTLSCTKHQTLCPSYSLFLHPSAPLLSSFTSSLLCCALAHQNNKALMFYSTSPLFAATDLTKLHYKPESSILSGPIH